MTSRPRLVVLGRQGSGKGTQSALLAAHLDVPHLSTGELFRAAVRAGTPVGEQVDHLLVAGALVPDDLVIDVVRDEARRSSWATTGFVLDGFPRTVAQAVAFFGEPHLTLPPPAALADGGGSERGAPGATPEAEFDAAIELDVPLAEVRRRMASRRVCPVCGTTVTVEDPTIESVPCPRGDGTAVRRRDDRDDAIEQRLSLYELETGPLVPWFESWGRLVSIDGTGATDVVFGRLLEGLAPFVDLAPAPPG